MHSREHPITPLAAVTAGLLAGAVGTISMDAVRYVRYRRAGGKDNPLAWEFAPVASWDKAPDPGQVAKRVIEGFTQRELPDRWAWLTSTFMHWSYGSAWGALYGVVAGSLRRPHALYGVPFGAAVWTSGYVILPLGGSTSRSGNTTQRPWPARPERPPRLRRRHRSRFLATRQDLLTSRRPPSAPGNNPPPFWLQIDANAYTCVLERVFRRAVRDLLRK